MLKNLKSLNELKSATNYDALQSKTMDWLRFPLMVLVMFIHVDQQGLIDMQPSFVAHGIFFLVTQVIARIAVPLFFIISGYYFFYCKGKDCAFTKNMYLTKLKKRLRTLLVPYLFWNICVLSLFTAYYVFTKNERPTVFALVISLFNWKETGMPPAFQFWFIRDLMFVVLVSPVIYILIRYVKIIFVAILFGLWISPLHIPFITALFFFSLGAYFSVHNKNIIQTIRLLPSKALFLLTLVLMTVDLIINDLPSNTVHSTNNNLYIHNIFLLFGIVSSLALVSYGIENKRLKLNKFISDSSFFMFAIHPIPLVNVFNRIPIKFLPHNDFTFLLIYFFSVIAMAILSIFLYKYMKKYFPKFTSIITGGR